MIDVYFVVPAAPLGKERARTVRMPNGASRSYTPKRTVTFEAQVAAAAGAVMPAPVIEEPVQVDILAVLARPKRLQRRLDPKGLTWAPVRPDADNVRKAVLDALDGFWLDDSLVVAGQTLKVYAEKFGGRPRVEVRICSAPALHTFYQWVVYGGM